MVRSTHVIGLLAAILLPSVSASFAGDWPQILGPHRNGKADDEQLLNKLDEGLAKQVMPEKVLQALESRGRHLRDAKEVVDQLIMQGWTTPDYELAVALVADAMGAGQTPSQIVRVVRDGVPGSPGAPDVARAFLAPGQVQQ